MAFNEEKTNPSIVIYVSSNEQNHDEQYYKDNYFCGLIIYKYPLLGFSSLFSQNLTIDFVVENRAPYEVEYKSMVASISHDGNIVGLNALGVYRQQKGECSSIQVIFSNFPIKIMENRTSGFVVFTVEVKGNYESYDIKVSCRDVRLKFSSIKQETRLLQKCSTRMF
ncbi:hypothetical protein P3L10_020114 [Capsicum annuum]